jgi:hypothetical protein
MSRVAVPGRDERWTAMSYADEYDSLVLGTLCGEPGAWTMEEIVREFGYPLKAEDAVNRLAMRGMLVKLESGLIITTAAGRYACAIEKSAS